MMNALNDDLVFQCVNKVAIMMKLHVIDIISINKIKKMATFCHYLIQTLYRVNYRGLTCDGLASS